MNTDESFNGMANEPVVAGYRGQSLRNGFNSTSVCSQKRISLSELEKNSMTVEESERILTEVIHQQYCK
jgi:hypothetical protein